MLPLVTKYDERAYGSFLTITDEAHTIGEDTANYVFLNEVPSATTTVTVSGTPAGGGSFTEVDEAPPSAGEFVVFYAGRLAGGIQFNANDDDIDVEVSYEGRGSSFFARDINRIHERLQYNVVDYGAKGDGTTDDTTAIQAAVDATGVGGAVFFPPGTYLISSALVLKPNRYYQGPGLSTIMGAVIKQADGSNIVGGMMVSEAWDDNSTLADGPVVVRDLALNGNKANNAGATTTGLLLQNYYCVVENVDVFSCTGDGISFTEVNKAGSGITGTAVENRVVGCRITQVDGNGMSNTTGASVSAMTDGLIKSCIIGATGKNGITLPRGAGWKVVGNHIYNTGFHAVRMGNTSASSVSDNAIEDYGVSATTGTYAGVSMFSMLNRRPCLIAHNTIYNGSAVGGSTYYGIEVASATGATDADVTVSGNACSLSGSEKFVRIGGPAAFTVTVLGNRVSGIVTRGAFQRDNASEVVHTGNSFDLAFDTFAAEGTPSVGHGSRFETAAGSVTVTDFTDGFDGQKIFILFKHSGYTIDFTGTTLKGNAGVDWSPANGDHMTCVFDGTNWYCDVSDNTA